MKKLKKVCLIILLMIFIFLVALLFMTYKKNPKHKTIKKIKREVKEIKKSELVFKNFKILEEIISKNEFKIFKSETKNYFDENKIKSKKISYNNDLIYKNKKYYFSFTDEKSKKFHVMFEIETDIFLFNEKAFDDLESVTSSDIIDDENSKEPNENEEQKFEEDKEEVHKDLEEQRKWDGGDGECVE